MLPTRLQSPFPASSTSPPPHRHHYHSPVTASTHPPHPLQVLRPFHRLTKASLDALRYRGEDIARSITKHVISEARTKELRLELLNSERLKEYFEEHAAEKWVAGRGNLGSVRHGSVQRDSA
jgi:hypothetical protein